MKRIYYPVSPERKIKKWILFILLLLCSFFVSVSTHAQTNCGPATPTYTVNLTGNPNGTWISPVVSRNDTCCGVQAPDVCVQFIITLDPLAQGISFNIYSGAIPPGAMFYQINCGPPVIVGSPICLNGVGPHYLTFCKPGNNSNEYIITSLGDPGTQGDTMSMGCTSGNLYAWSYYEPSITWTSIFPGPQGAYNSYLNCTAGCDTVIVTPQQGAPSFIDFQICGLKASLCDTIPVCDTVRIYIFSTLQVSISGSQISCNGSSNGSLTANASGGAAPYSYQWSNGNTTQTINGLPAGNYSVTIVDANGCFISDTASLIQPAPLVVSNSQTNVSCNGGNNGSASLTVSGGTAPYSYTWNNGQTTSAIHNLAAGNYSVTVIDANGCTITSSFLLTQPPVLMAVKNSIPETCAQANGSASVFPSGGTQPYTYYWLPCACTSNSIHSLAAGSYTAIITDANGCSYVDTFMLSGTVPPNLSTSASPVSCFGGNNGNALATASGAQTPYTYFWSNGNTTANASGLSAGNYSVTVTSANGCTQTSTVSILQPAFLTAGITNSQNVSCFLGSDGIASATGNGGTNPYSYLWNNGQTSQTASGLPAGNYSVVITDANGCTAMNTVSITQPNAISVTTTPDDTICPNSSATITASASGGTPPLNYFWQPNNSTGNSQTVNPSTNTTYTAIITDANGCTAIAFTTLYIYNMNLSVVMNASSSICVGQTATLSASASGNNIVSYYWSNNLGNGTGPYTVSPNATTTYSVTITNICGATATSAATVTVNPVPVVYITPQSVNGCNPTPVQFADTNAANNGFSYSWNFGDGYTSSQPGPVHTYTQTGNYQVTVIVTSNFGCQSTETTSCSVTIFPAPQADFTSDPGLETSIINPDFRFFDQSSNTTIWYWDFGDGINSSLQNPLHTYAQTGIYEVKLVTQNNDGCIDSVIKTVEVKPEFTFYVPNAFTPNGDHNNDVFNGKGIEIIEFEMLIFDRWGNQIFKTNNLDEGWDGRANAGAEIAQQDVYVYKIMVKDFEKKEHRYIGNVNLIK